MHKEYYTPEVRLRLLDCEYSLLTASFTKNQNEEIEEDEYEW